MPRRFHFWLHVRLLNVVETLAAGLLAVDDSALREGRMDRPKTPQLDALIATVEEMRRVHERYQALKARTSTEAHALYDIPDPDLRLKSAAYAYWYAHEVTAGDLAFGALRQSHPSKLVKLLGAETTDIPCDRCGIQMEITSRAAMAELQKDRHPLPEGFRVVCPPCREAIFEARHFESDKQQRAISRRMVELGALPYAA